ncbi:MAG: hypothetical protein ACREJM_00125 [Candidatus Saccharimonadales bacterium]
MLDLMDEEFEAGHAVAVCRQPDTDVVTASPSWMLLTGYRKLDGRKGSIHTLDPSRRNFHYMGRHMIGSMVEGSASLDTTSHVYALNVRPGPATRTSALGRAVRRGLAMFAEGLKYDGGSGFGGFGY